MCGIAGMFAYGSGARELVDETELLRVRDHMLNRGPDGCGIWIASDKRVGLAHRRLAIIDLSPSGSQPMATADKDLVVTFNGEIYNYRELRGLLTSRGCSFRSNSDTEVLLHLYREYGERMVDHLRGMYAFALWQQSTKTLFMARDPFGIKPLYYADNGETLRFASTVKALIHGGRVDSRPCAAGRAGFFVWGHVPEPHTIYRGIRALPAGHTLMVRQHQSPSISRYYCLRREIIDAHDCGAAGSREGTADIVRNAVRDSIQSHLVADVPLGVFLSSGIDSSIILGVASEFGGTHLSAVTLGFREFLTSANDESVGAATVAAHYGVPHAVDWIDKREFSSNLHAMLDAMDQPSIDGVNCYFVSRAASQHGWKVALSGVGGDEVTSGYPGFVEIPRLRNATQWCSGMPQIGRMARKLSAPVINRISSPKYASLLEYGGTIEGAYLLRRALFLPWELASVMDPDLAREGLEELNLRESIRDSVEGISSDHLKITALEMDWYLRDQLLRDADWAGMAHSLEIRVPLVDVKLFRALLPALVSGHSPQKLDLAAAPSRPLPDAILRREKTGFSIPVQQWIADAWPSAIRGRGLRAYGRRLALTWGEIDAGREMPQEMARSREAS